MPDVPLPLLPTLQSIKDKLPLIFPDNSAIVSRNAVIGDMAARTIFVMFYNGAIEGSNRWIQPGHVYNMSDAQAARTDNQSRLEWGRKRRWQGGGIIDPWYADTTRESIRDETIVLGLIPLNACIRQRSVETTQGLPRYALKATFASLFDENLPNQELINRINSWQRAHLSREALMAVDIRRLDNGNPIPVTIPNGHRILAMNLPPGKSSLITKMVIENFSVQFLHEPHVVSISTSETGFTPIDERMIQRTNLNFSTVAVQNILPDIILYDIFSRNGRQDTLLVFIEVVATGGVMNKIRKDIIQNFLHERGYDLTKVAYGTAFFNRSDPAYNKKNISEIAWGTFIWFVNEPDKLIIMKGTGTENNRKLSDLME